MEKEKGTTQLEQNELEMKYQELFGSHLNNKPTELERQGYFTQYSAYSHETVTYASNTRR